jgi:hypothetical protein
MYIEIYSYQILLRPYLIFLSTTVIDEWHQNIKSIIFKNIKTCFPENVYNLFVSNQHFRPEINLSVII